MTESRAERIRRLFDACLNLDRTQRDQMLDVACAADASMRREIEELLAADAEPDSTAAPSVFNDSPIDGAAMRWLAAVTHGTDAATEPPPARIGSFRIIREIGRGGMGMVYEAQQEEPSRLVAIKVIRAGLVSRGLLRRFAQETRALAQLRHPGIAQILEVGTSILPGSLDTRPYFVMELVRGQTLLRFAQDEALSTPQRLELLARVCDALHHAHQKGVIHRDLKPDNILVQQLAESAPAGQGTLDLSVQPKILDFGVARLIEEPETGSLGTTAGQIVGTVPYLSPEQAVGKSSEADIRSDIYSVGVIAFELLSGRLPFDVQDMPLHAAVRRVLETNPRRMSADRPSLRGDIETMVAKAMDHEPARRYQSAADVAADFRRFLRNEPIAARAPSTGYVLGKFFQRHRALVATVGASLFLLIAALVLVSVLLTKARAAEIHEARLRYQSAMSAAGFALSKGEIGIARQQMESADLRFRGWEFSHFESRLDQCEQVFRPQQPGPFHLVPGELEGMAGYTLVDPKSGLLVRSDDQFENMVRVDPRLTLWYAARAARDLNLLTLKDGTVYVPDRVGGVEAIALTAWRFPPDQEFSNPRLSEDGRTLAMLTQRSVPASIVVIDLVKRSVNEIVLAPDIRARRLAISRDGQRLAVVTGLQQARPPLAQVYDVATANLHCTIDPLPSEAFSLLLSADGTRLTAAFHGGPIGVWDVATRESQELVFNPYDFDTVENMTASPDESLLAVGPNDGIIRILDARTLEIRYSLIGHGSEVTDIRFIDSGRHLLSAGRNGEVRRWRLADPPPNPMVLRGHTHLIHGLAIGEAGNFIATGSWDATVRLFDSTSGTPLASMPAGTFVQALALSPDERLIATREFGGVVSLYDVAARTRLTRLDRPMQLLDMPAFDSDSRRLLTDIDPAARTATWWNITDGAWVVTPLAETANLGRMPVSAGGAVAYTQIRDQKMMAIVIDARSGKELLAVEVRRHASESLAFTPDGLAVLAADANHTIQAYALADGRSLGAYRGHVREVLALAFSSDGTRLFSADYTGAILVWDTATRDELTQLRGHEANVRRLVVSRDGTTLISGSRDGTARVWRANLQPSTRETQGRH